eukprot:1799547-Prymnesium_polylepis.1
MAATRSRSNLRGCTAPFCAGVVRASSHAKISPCSRASYGVCTGYVEGSTQATERNSGRAPKTKRALRMFVHVNTNPHTT